MSEEIAKTPHQVLYASDKVNLCLLPIGPALLCDPTAAPRSLPLLSCWCPQVPFAATSRRPPICCTCATTHARPVPGPAGSESTCRVLARLPGEGPESESLGSGRGWKKSCRCWGRGGEELDGRCGYVSPTVELLRTYAPPSLKDDRPPPPME